LEVATGTQPGCFPACAGGRADCRSPG
jgi:hypothetical protein